MHNQTAILFFYKGKKMKLLSFAIPCYNSKDYMEHCIESILPGGDDVEIIIVDDGSKDETAAIADRYAAEYPDIVKAVHQENGGHGQAVNTGLKNATGKYFKVVDSDDWVDLDSYKKILDKLREFEQEDTQIDMLLANYVYEKEGARRKKVMRQTGFPRNEIFTWSDIKSIAQQVKRGDGTFYQRIMSALGQNIVSKSDLELKDDQIKFTASTKNSIVPIIAEINHQ